MKALKRHIILIVLLIFSVTLFNNCIGGVRSGGNDKNSNESSESHHPTSEMDSIQTTETKLETPTINIYIENSGSMKAYISNSSSNYINVLSEITENPMFIENKVEKNIYMTSGISSPIKVENLKGELTPSNFNQGSSNLNALFKLAMNKSTINGISILVSDGIYDMCPDQNPLGTLSILGKELRSSYIQELHQNNFETIVVKLTSNYNGRYYPGNCSPAYNINQERPYYVWIFGKSKLLEEYFPNDYLEKLKGFEELARYFKVEVQSNNYMPVAHKLIGKYKHNKSNERKLSKVRAYKGVFQYSIAVDFSSLPLSDNYLMDSDNYEADNGFEIVEIEKPNNTVKMNFNKATHVIVLRKSGNPLGSSNVTLLNRGYSWISETNTNNDTNIIDNISQTFGFETLSQGIVEAYQHYNGEYFYEFNITLNN